MWFAGSQEIEIGTVEEENLFCWHVCLSMGVAILLSPSMLSVSDVDGRKSKPLDDASGPR